MQGTIFFSFLLFAINKAYFLLNPRNIISNIIMIFNINSTRGHTGSLLVTATYRVEFVWNDPRVKRRITGYKIHVENCVELTLTQPRQSEVDDGDFDAGTPDLVRLSVQTTAYHRFIGASYEHVPPV